MPRQSGSKPRRALVGPACPVRVPGTRKRGLTLARVLTCFVCIAQSPLQAQAVPGSAQPFTVLLDAAHGGQETGTLLSAQLTEKELVLALSIHLRSALAARGMRVITTREGDTDPSPLQRAAQANHAHPAACLVLHATASGSGVHLYTSSAAGSPVKATQTATATALTPWTAAGAPFTTDSLQLASEISAALGSAAIPFTLGRVRMESLDAMECPVVAVEIASLHPVAGAAKSASAAIGDPAYQQKLVDALAAALLQWRSERDIQHNAGTAR